MDAETMRLPDAFTLPGIALGVVYVGASAANSTADLRPSILGEMLISIMWAVVAALLLLAIRWLYFLVRHKEGLGMGDVKLLAMIAAWLGPAPTILTLFFACLATALFGILAVASSRGSRPFKSTRLPLGSFLCAAALYVVFAGQPILTWYLHFYGLR
jgi:leader peptidase (prepilin peptidase) / N-methyltransferase